MTRASHAPHEHAHPDRAHSDKERRPRAETSASQGSETQGIVRDERGQEQPADKERAQQVSKSE